MLETIIGKGRERALTLQEIISITGMTSRAIRKEVGQLQESGLPIINLQDGKGYYIANSEDYQDIQRYIRQEESRGIKSLIRASAIRRYLKTNGIEPVDMLTEGKLI